MISANLQHAYTLSKRKFNEGYGDVTAEGYGGRKVTGKVTVTVYSLKFRDEFWSPVTHFLPFFYSPFNALKLTFPGSPLGLSGFFRK
jgi:hypothetical protein